MGSNRVRKQQRQEAKSSRTYEKTYTLPIKAENSTIAQKLVLEDELHNISSEDILPQKNNKELYEADDIDFIYTVNWVQEVK